jgi:hypothetical protein
VSDGEEESKLAEDLDCFAELVRWVMVCDGVRLRERDFMERRREQANSWRMMWSSDENKELSPELEKIQ